MPPPPGMPPGMPPRMPGWGQAPFGGPPPFGPPPWQRPKRVIFRTVVTTILVILLLNLIGANLAFFAAIGAAAQSKVKQTTVIDGGTDTIAAIPVTGLIDDDTATLFDQFLTAAESDKNVKAIVLEIDTPGGSATPPTPCTTACKSSKTT